MQKKLLQLNFLIVKSYFSLTNKRNKYQFPHVVLFFPDNQIQQFITEDTIRVDRANKS